MKISRFFMVWSDVSLHLHNKTIFWLDPLVLVFFLMDDLWNLNLVSEKKSWL